MDTKQIFKKSKNNQSDIQENEKQQKMRVESLINFYENNPIFYNREIKNKKSVEKKPQKSDILSKISGKSDKPSKVKSNFKQKIPKEPKQKESQDKGTNCYIILFYRKWKYNPKLNNKQ